LIQGSCQKVRSNLAIASRPRLFQSFPNEAITSFPLINKLEISSTSTHAKSYFKVEKFGNYLSANN